MLCGLRLLFKVKISENNLEILKQLTAVRISMSLFTLIHMISSIIDRNSIHLK